METANNHFGLRIAILAIAMAAWQPRVLFSAETGAAKERTGMYFAKKAYEAKPLPKFAELRSQLPSPIYDDNPVLVQAVLESLGVGVSQLLRTGPAERVCLPVHRRRF